MEIGNQLPGTSQGDPDMIQTFFAAEYLWEALYGTPESWILACGKTAFSMNTTSRFDVTCKKNVLVPSNSSLAVAGLCVLHESVSSISDKSKALRSLALDVAVSVMLAEIAYLLF